MSALFIDMEVDNAEVKLCRELESFPVELSMITPHQAKQALNAVVVVLNLLFSDLLPR